MKTIKDLKALVGTAPFIFRHGNSTDILGQFDGEFEFVWSLEDALNGAMPIINDGCTPYAELGDGLQLVDYFEVSHMNGRQCTCDLHSVLLRNGCQCGGV